MVDPSFSVKPELDCTEKNLQYLNSVRWKLQKKASLRYKLTKNKAGYLNLVRFWGPVTLTNFASCSMFWMVICLSSGLAPWEKSRQNLPKDNSRLLFATSREAGMTGLAQINGLSGPIINRQVIVNRTKYDLELANTLNFKIYIKIIFATFMMLVRNTFSRRRKRNWQGEHALCLHNSSRRGHWLL